MIFRDDHEAAIHRIDALEQELADERTRARERAEHDARIIAMLRRAAAREPSPVGLPTVTTVADVVQTPPRDARPLAGAGPAVSRAAVVCLLVLTGGVIGLALGVLV